MKPFDYIAVSSLAEAAEVLGRLGPEACVLAGGTDLLLEWRRGQPRGVGAVVDISRANDLRGIAELDGSFVLRPLCTHTMLANSERLRTSASLLAQSAASVGSVQIRNRGTVGGNIMNAATCADTVPALIALDATIRLVSKRSERQMPLGELFLKPYRTKAEPDEVLSEIRFAKLAPDSESVFVKLGRRNALSIARLSVAAVLQIGRDARIADARIVPGAALPLWRRVSQAEQMLVGEKPSVRLFAAAGKKVADVMIAETGRRWSTEYKEPVIAVLVRRALEECARKFIRRNGEQG